MIDTSTPVPGPYRPPRDTERRTRLMLCAPWRDCVDVAEMNPDLEEHTDPTMRLLAASWDLLQLAGKVALDYDDPNYYEALALVRYVHSTDNRPPPRPHTASNSVMASRSLKGLADRVRDAHAAWARWEALSADEQAAQYHTDTGHDAPGYGYCGAPISDHDARIARAMDYVAWRGATRDRLQAELRDAVAALPA